MADTTPLLLVWCTDSYCVATSHLFSSYRLVSYLLWLKQCTQSALSAIGHTHALDALHCFANQEPIVSCCIIARGPFFLHGLPLPTIFHSHTHTRGSHPFSRGHLCYNQLWCYKHTIPRPFPIHRQQHTRAFLILAAQLSNALRAPPSDTRCRIRKHTKWKSERIEKESTQKNTDDMGWGEHKSGQPPIQLPIYI